MKRIPWLSLTFWSALSIAAGAHGLMISAEMQPDHTLRGHVYFVSANRPAGAQLSVRDASGNEIRHGVSENDGAFSFRMPKQGPWTIVANLGDGHVARLTVNESGAASPEKHVRFTHVAGGIALILALGALAKWFLRNSAA